MATQPEDRIKELGLPQPWAQSHANFIYNLLFCDVPELFRTASGDTQIEQLLFREPPDFSLASRMAFDGGEESRQRLLAFNFLRQHGQTVPPKLLLGVIVEVPLEGGLNVIAAYADARARYINQTGKIGVFEVGPKSVVEKARALMEVAQPIVLQTGPWLKPRLPPPASGSARITCLVSDGLYFGEGPFKYLAADPLGAPVMKAAQELLLAATDAVFSPRPH